MGQKVLSKPWFVQVPEECPAEIEQLIDLCLATEPADRPTAKQAFDIISSCSPHLPALAPPTPAPIPHQQAALSPDDPESWVEMPAVETVEINSIPMGSLGDQSRQQSLSGVPSYARCMQSISQQPAPASGGDSSADELAVGHELPLKGQSISQNALHQFQTADMSSATAQERHDHEAGLQKGHQLPYQQQQAGDEDSMYSLAGSDNASLPTAAPMHLEKGSQGTLPLGVFGHLYPSPFDMADDESGASSWCWQTGQAVSGVHSDPDLSGPQR